MIKTTQEWKYDIVNDIDGEVIPMYNIAYSSGEENKPYLGATIKLNKGYYGLVDDGTDLEINTGTYIPSELHIDNIAATKVIKFLAEEYPDSLFATTWKDYFGGWETQEGC